MTSAADRTSASDALPLVHEVATGVHCLGLGGRTQTNVYLVSSDASWSLIDAGWSGDGPTIITAAGHLFGVGRGPTSILLTHAHPDHSGAARELSETWDCPIYVHPRDMPIATGDFGVMVAAAGPLDRWLILPLMRAIGRRRRETIIARSSLAGLVQPLGTEEHVPGLPGWRWVPTPGHTPGHVSFVRTEDRVLITGDAVVNLQVNSVIGAILGRSGLSGPPWYTTWSSAAAARSIADLARLEPTVVAGGHGRPISGGETAVRLRVLATRASRSRAARAGTSG